MNLHYLKVKNFGIIKQKLFTFNNGINLISGDNGSGKSTILKALALLLFNYTKGKLEDYINWNANSFELEIEFEHNSKLFKQTYIYDGKSSNRDLYIDNQYYKNSDAVTELNTYFNSKVSLASIISFEGEIDLIHTRPSDRREHLKNIYDLNFKSEIDKIDQEIKYLKDEKQKELDQEIYFLENKEYNLFELKEYPFDKEDYLDIKENLLALKKHYNELEIEQKEYYNKKKEIGNLHNDLIEYEEELKKINDNVYTDENLQLQKEEWNKQIQLLQDELDKTDWNKKVDELQSKLNDITVLRIRKFDNTLLENTANSLVQSNGLIEQWNNYIEQAKQGKCPVCGKEVTEEDYKNFEIELQKEKENNKEILEKLNKLKIDKEKNEKLVKQNDDNIREKKYLEKEIENEKQTADIRKQDLHDKIEYEKKSIEEKIEKYLELQNLYSTQKLSIEKNITNINNKLFKLEKQLEEYEEIDLNELKDNMNNLENEIKAFDAIEAYNKECEKKNKELEKQKQIDIKTKKDLIKQKEKLLKDIDNLTKSKSILQKEFPTFVISKMIQSLEKNINDFIEKTYDGRYKIKIIENKNALYVVYGEKEKDVSLASGYEKQLFSLAYKHGLSQIQNLGIILLDEVDSQASEEKSEILYHTIGQMNDIYNQTFVITHRELVKEVLENNYNANLIQF